MKEKYLGLSGLMFLVAIKSLEMFQQILPAALKTCDLGPRFAGSLVASTLAVAMFVSLAFTGYYFKQYIEALREEN